MSPSSPDSFVSNVFIDWNSLLIFDKYLDKYCELCMSSQVVEDDDETFFVQTQKTIDFTGELFKGQIYSPCHRRIR